MGTLKLKPGDMTPVLTLLIGTILFVTVDTCRRLSPPVQHDPAPAAPVEVDVVVGEDPEVVEVEVLLEEEEEEKTPTWSKDAWSVAKVCVNEAGFRTDTNDCEAIYSVLSWQADRRNISLDRMARIYSKSVFNPDREHRGWVPNLRKDLEQPRSWPSTADWYGVSQSRWKHRLDSVQGYIDNDSPGPCEKPVFHWGTENHPVDRERIQRGIARGYWHPVDCGPTLNTFLAPGKG